MSAREDHLRKPIPERPGGFDSLDCPTGFILKLVNQGLDSKVQLVLVCTRA